MEGLLFESTVRSALIAAGTAVVLWAFGIKTADARHRAWSAVMLLMLLLPTWTVVGPTLSLRVLPPAPAPLELPSEPVRYFVPNTFMEPVARPLETPAVAQPASSSFNWQ